jgi:predicted solute-binding protein
VDFDHPSALCQRLAKGELDVALVSSFEFLRNPIYRIVDHISISSSGPVYSVLVAHHEDISEVEEIELDPAAETSGNLLRCLLAERNLAPRFSRASASAIGARRGRLSIGDQAIRLRQEHAGEFRFWDLGEEWKRLVDLPCVYALWRVRPEVADIDNLIGEEKQFDHDFCRRYYRENLRFGFGEKEKEGLRIFAKLCAKHGLLSKPGVVFDLV